MSRVTTVIACADLPALVYTSLVSVERQSHVEYDIVLVTDETTPTAARSWIDEVARVRGLRRVDAERPLAAAVWNAGIEGADSDYVMCLDAGDQIDRSLHELALGEFEQSDVDIVTSWMQSTGPGPGQRLAIPRGVDLDSVLDDPDALHSASMFKRSDWEAVGGFDEGMIPLEEYDFWLRLMARGARAVVIPRPLVYRTARERAPYRRRWQDERTAGAWRRLVERHAELFGRDPATRLYSRERRLGDLAEAYRGRLADRDRAVDELGSLKARSDELRGTLPPELRDAADLGDLRRVTPLSRNWGCERGTPIDRHYIERFLQGHASDIRGTVLEVQKPDYTYRFGADRVTCSDIVDIDHSNPQATVVSDLRRAANLPSATYDCIILTQTLHVIDDMPAAIRECERLLKPGGVLLATVPSSSRVCLEYGLDGDFWRVTEAGARTLVRDAFPGGTVDVGSQGNVLVNAAFLFGLAAHELTEEEFSAADPYYPLLVTVRAQKAGSAQVAVRSGHTAEPRGAILLYHRVGRSDADVHGLSIATDAFLEQMTYLREHCRPMTLDALTSAARSGHVPARAVAVTFDDGYLDNLTVASPVLVRLGIPATFFLTTERLDDDRYEYWWDALERLLIASGASAPPELTIGLPEGQRTFAARSAADRLAAHTAIYQSVVGSPAKERNAVICALEEWSTRALERDPHGRRLSTAEVVELASMPGHSIGAHSNRHLMLPRQPATLQREEIVTSRQTLEKLLGRPITAFAYPFGAYSDETVEIVRETGFEVALTCDAAPVQGAVDVLRLPRLEVRPGERSFNDWLERWLSSPSPEPRISSPESRSASS